MSMEMPKEMPEKDEGKLRDFLAGKEDKYLAGMSEDPLNVLDTKIPSDAPDPTEGFTMDELKAEAKSMLESRGETK